MNLRSETEVFRELAALCTSSGYIHALALLCFRDNIVSYDTELTAEHLRHMHSPERLIRTELSTLHGLMIKAPIDYTLPASSVMQSYVERSDALLAELHHCISAPQFDALTQAVKSGWKTNPLTQGDALREAIFYGGESAYTFQYQQLTHKKYSRDANWLRSHKAFTIDGAFQVARAIQVIQNRKITSRLSDLRQLPVEKWTVLPAFSFSVLEIASESHVPADEVRHVLRAFSLPQSEGNSKFRSISDFNAANAWPLLEQVNGDFLLLQTYALLESMYESPFYWMLGDSSYMDEAMKHRGEFAEGFAHERLEVVFGRERVFSNVEILAGDGSKAGEIDVLVVYADRIVIVQAKAKRLTIEARKGNDGHIRSDFKAAIQDAYEQGYRCATTLEDSAYTLRAASGAHVKLDAIPKEIFILCMVSDHYPALAFQASQFLKYHTTESIQPPLVTDVFLLDAMTEMLNSPLHFLSYAKRRTNYSERILAAHELTILSYHLKKNLWLERDANAYLHDDLSTDLDVAMAVRRLGMPGRDTPDGILTRLTHRTIGKIVRQIETRAEPGLIDFGFLLLTLSETATSNISNAIDQIVQKTELDGECHDLTVPMVGEGTGLTVHATEEPREMARARLVAHCERRKYIHKVRTWFGICVTSGDQPLRFGVSFDFPWEQSDKLDREIGRFERKTPIRLDNTGRNNKIGRNEPCPCGSGIKYKKCCGK